MKVEPKINPTPSLLLDSALWHAQQDWEIFRLAPKSKIPYAGSRGFKDASKDPVIIKQWWDEAPESNIGLATGKVNMLMVLDVDFRHGGDITLAEFEKQFGPLPNTIRVKTSNGFHIYFLYPYELWDLGTVKFKANIGPGLDIKADNGYVVASTSAHPDGSVYHFDPNHHPDNTSLATPPQWLLDKACYFVTSKPQSTADFCTQVTTPYGRAILEGEAAVIASAPIGLQEQTLNSSALKVGGAVKAGEILYEDALEAVVQAGLNMVNDPNCQPWTYENVSRKVRRALDQATARTRKSTSPVQKVSKRRAEEPSVDELPTEEHSESVKLPNCFLNSPGIFGEIVKYMNQTAMYPSIPLALAATIPFLGIIKAHKVETATGLRTNFYTTGIAGSGAGKEHHRRAIKFMLDAVNAATLLGGDPASTAGLFKAVVDGQGKRLLLIDEVGPFLKGSLGPKAPSHIRGAAALLTKFLTSANTKFVGNEYANSDGSRPREDIDQPHLCIYGTTTPGEFYSALTSGDALNGFLARFLNFEEKHPPLYKNKGRLPLSTLPESIKLELERWKNQPTNVSPLGNLDALEVIRPMVFQFQPEAEVLLEDYAIEMRKKAFSSSHRNTGRDAIYNRAAEHAEKLALVATDIGESYISLATTQWAIEVVTYCTEWLCQALDKFVSDNANEARIKRVLNILEEHGSWMTSTELTKRTQFLDLRQRSDIIYHLIDTNAIESEQTKSATKPTTRYRFRK